MRVNTDLAAPDEMMQVDQGEQQQCSAASVCNCNWHGEQQLDIGDPQLHLQDQHDYQP